MSQYSITPEPVKFELHAYSKVYNVSNSIRNWKNIEVKIQRNGTSSTYPQISFPFEFVLDGYDIIKSIFEEYMHRAKADIYIYLRKENWPYVSDPYEQPEIFHLDWTSYEETETVISMSTESWQLWDILRARRKLNYDIPVAEIKAPYPWNFQRINLENTLNMHSFSEIDVTRTHSSAVSLGMSLKNSEVSVPDKMIIQNVSDGGNPQWFIQSAETLREPLDLQIKGDLKIPSFSLIPSEGTEINYASIGFYRIDENNVSHIIGHCSIPINQQGEYRGPIDNKFKVNTSLEPYDSVKQETDKIYFMVAVSLKSESEQAQYRIKIEQGYEFDFTLVYQAKHDPVNIDVIDPKILLQTLVDRITGTTGEYATGIEEFNESEDDLIMMAAAESIRGFEKANVHTSYDQFMTWMEVFGYEQYIDEKTLLFRKRAKSFREDLTAIELDETECAGLKTSINTDYLFSGLKVGYNRKDIENTNVRFEFNGIQEYTTDLDIQENVLEKISPYRADCYGIEFLAQERGKDTTDNKADKDLFLVNLEFNGEPKNEYSIKAIEFVGNLPYGDGKKNGLFNGQLSPYFLMKIHTDLLGISANELEFTGSDSNTGIIIEGQPINDNYSIPPENKLFDPIMYDIASKNIRTFPKGDFMNGIVRLNFQGKIHEGYINQISRNPAWETETTWLLLKKCHK